ncbi:unnamed protein product, partial [Prorocentrum cordatum]
MCAVYVLTSLFFTMADAALFNLSLLTSDFYSALFAWQVQHGRMSWLYGVAFCLSLGGLGTAVDHVQPPAAAEPARGLREAALLCSEAPAPCGEGAAAVGQQEPAPGHGPARPPRGSWTSARDA